MAREFTGETIERIRALLTAKGLSVPGDLYGARVHAGYWQRAQGAWSWFVQSRNENQLFEYGSQDTLASILSAGPDGVEISAGPDGKYGTPDDIHNFSY